MGFENKNQQTPSPKLSDDNLSKKIILFFHNYSHISNS